MALIHLENVDLHFSVRRDTRLTIKGFLLNRFFGKGESAFQKIQALRDISLRVEEGDRVGILGHNGAGKSTLLKLLAGVYPPSGGKRTVEGKISSLFDLAIGFELDATGWENIAFRGYLQGETPASIRQKQQAIAEFTELGDRLNTPVRYFSAGMLIRLAFAIATSIDPEILLLDEVLAVGDLAFQHKARARMLQMMERARLMVMVSHDLTALRQLCTRVVWMDRGEVRQMGPAAEVIQAYEASVRPPAPLSSETDLLEETDCGIAPSVSDQPMAA